MRTILIKSLVMTVMLLFLYNASCIAQSCNSSMRETTPADRFTFNGDGTVTDMKTGLMWKQCSEGQTGDDCSGSAKLYSWQAALQQAQTVNSGGGYAGYSDWRVPNINELSTIVEYRCYNPAINLSAFPATPAGSSLGFWSSSSLANNANAQSWFIDFYYGERKTAGRLSTGYLRLVRGGN